jgi:glycosyltransferase involved in cell wall biosynthesis
MGYMDKLIITRCPAMVCHGPFLKQQLLDIGTDRDKIFEYDWKFSDLDSGEDGFVELTRKSKDNVVLFLGRIEEHKGVFDLLDAVEEIQCAHTSVKLVYIGDGSAMDELRCRVEHRGLEQQVVLLGMIPHNHVGALIRRARVLVTPTRSDFPEGRCMAAMEGLVMGVPVIAPDLGPFPYLIESGINGLLFRPDSIQDLKEKLCSLLHNEELYLRVRQGVRLTGMSLRQAPVSFKEAIRSALDVVQLIG